MRYTPKTIDAFFALLRAGLWERGVEIRPYEPFDFDALYELADEQSVVGLLAAGLEHVEDRKLTKHETVRFLKKVFSLESRNMSMNEFIPELVGGMREAGIYSVLVKGQGVAQCYERPLWRSSGDVDLLLNNENYEKAKIFLVPIASNVDKEDKRNKHYGLTIDSWRVELHGTLHGSISRHIDQVIDMVQDYTLSLGEVRSWNYGDNTVFLPEPNNDVILIFSHILQHFFKGGIGLRQICDLCRVLWSFRDTINNNVLESYISRMRVVSEWKSFASFIVDYLDMPKDAMPLYDSGIRWKLKAKRICNFVLRVGNFGYNRDSSIYKRYPYLVYKFNSFWRHFGDFLEQLFIFPLDSLRVFVWKVRNGIRAVVRGK